MTRASSSGTPWRCTIASARALPRSSSRSRQARPVAERSTPRKWRFNGAMAMLAACNVSPRRAAARWVAIRDYSRALEPGLATVAIVHRIRQPQDGDPLANRHLRHRIDAWSHKIVVFWMALIFLAV